MAPETATCKDGKDIILNASPFNVKDGKLTFGACSCTGWTSSLRNLGTNPNYLGFQNIGELRDHVTKTYPNAALNPVRGCTVPEGTAQPAPAPIKPGPGTQTQTKFPDADKLVRESQGRPGVSGGGTGHAESHIPPAGATPEQIAALAQKRSAAQITGVFASREIGLAALDHVQKENAAKLTALRPGGTLALTFENEAFVTFPRSDVGFWRPQAGCGGVAYATRGEAVFQKLPDGKLHLVTFYPSVPRAVTDSAARCKPGWNGEGIPSPR